MKHFIGVFMIFFGILGMAGDRIIPMVVPGNWDVSSGDYIFLEVEYRTSPSEPPVFVETSERVWWIQETPLVVLGSTGTPLPSEVIERNLVFVTLTFDGEAITEAIEVHPRKESIKISQDEKALQKAILKTVGSVNATYLAQVSHYLANNLATLDVTGSSYSIDGYGEVISSGGTWMGQPVTGSSPWTPEGNDIRFNTGRVFLGGISSGGTSLISGSSPTASIGAYFVASLTNGTGMYGVASGSNGIGLRGAAPNGTGVFANGGAKGLHATSTNGTGVLGEGSSGVVGTGSLYGVEATGIDSGLVADGGAYGVFATSSNGVGVSASGQEFGVKSFGTTAIMGYGDQVGVKGQSNGVTGNEQGVYGHSKSNAGFGVFGFADNPSGNTYGVGGQSDSSTGRALNGYASSSSGINYGIRATTNSSSGWAGYFVGDINVTGTVNKTGLSKTSMDHPLDPENQYLNHADVLSSELLTIYSGNITLDQKGSATVELPQWFEALNVDIRYQLTCIGGYADVYIAKKLEDNQFEISGGHNGLEVSWCLTALRTKGVSPKKAFVVEEQKPAEERGTLIEPELYKKKPSRSLRALRLKDEPDARKWENEND